MIHDITMASPIGSSLVLEDPEYVDTWIHCFAANARFKKLKDNKNRGGEIKINDCVVEMQVNTGSEVTILPRNLWEKMGKPFLKKSNVQLRQFDDSIIAIMGYFEGSIELKEKYEIVPIIVTNCQKSHGLLGNDVLKINSTKLINEIEMEKTGKLKNYEASLKLKENVSPSSYEARKIPVHLLPLVIAKLRKSIKEDLLEPAPPGGSKWASPIVVLKKKDGDLRICGDYKIGVNHKVCADSYPIPNVEVALHKLAGMKVFSKIDLKSAYHQIPINENFKEVTTINTPIGLLRWKRMPYSIKTASAIFPKAIEKVIGNVENTICYQDDICVGDLNEDDLKKKTENILNRLRDAGMTINTKKCVTNSEVISFLGYSISKEGISPDKVLIEKILKVATPKNKIELESFLGLVNFYRKYVPKYT